MGREHFGYDLYKEHLALSLAGRKDCFIQAGPHFRMTLRSRSDTPMSDRRGPFNGRCRGERRLNADIGKPTRLTQSGHPPVTTGILSVTPAQIVFRRHPQMLDEELRCWANAAVP